MKKDLVKKLKRLTELDKKISQLPGHSPIEKRVLEADQRFESVYWSNKLEGNKLGKDDVQKAIFAE